MKIRTAGIARLVALVIIFGAVSCSQAAKGPASNGSTPTAAASKPAENRAGPKTYSYEVVNKYPHDPNAFLQGLVWHDNGFYESTGGNGQSSLRRVELESGRVVKKVNLPEEDFGEGLAMVGDK